MERNSYERRLEAANEKLQERLEAALERLEEVEGLAKSYEGFRKHIFIYHCNKKEYDQNFTGNAVDSLWKEYHGHSIEADPEYQTIIDDWNENQNRLVHLLTEAFRSRNDK